MYLLEREISAYTGSSPCLGIFTSRETAERERIQYLQAIAVNDPWRDQAYHQTSPSDIRVIEIDVIGAPGMEGHLVSAYYEGFGQIVRRFVALHADRPAADMHAATLEEQEAATETMPNWCEVTTLPLDTLLYPSRD